MNLSFFKLWKALSVGTCLKILDPDKTNPDPQHCLQHEGTAALITVKLLYLLHHVPVKTVNRYWTGAVHVAARKAVKVHRGIPLSAKLQTGLTRST